MTHVLIIGCKGIPARRGRHGTPGNVPVSFGDEEAGR